MNATLEERLLDLFHQVIEDPDRIPAVPTEDWPEDAGQRRLLTGFREVLERLQQRQQDRLVTLREREEQYRSIFNQPGYYVACGWNAQDNTITFYSHF